MTILECPGCHKKYSVKNPLNPDKKYFCRKCGLELGSWDNGVFHDDITTDEFMSFLSDAPADAVNAFNAGRGTIDCKYVVIGKIGHGGTGEVYKAWDVSLKRYVAVKMLLPSAGEAVDDDGGHEDMLERFILEARTVAKLGHPNILQVYEIEKHKGNYCIIMEYADAGALDEYFCKKTAPQRTPSIEGVKDFLGIMLKIIRAIDYAHKSNIIHRDIKPENILLVTAPHGAVIPKISDFGLAKEITSMKKLTAAGTIMGTPEYMSPEQANAGAVDARTDIFSIGAVLYRLCTGVDPFYGKTVLEILEAVSSAEPVPPTVMNDRIDRDLETIILKCLEKDRNRRYATAGELADDIERYFQGEPVIARRATVVYRLSRRLAKNKATLAAYAVTAAVVLAAAVVYFLYYGRGESLKKEYLSSAEGFYAVADWEKAREAYIKYLELDSGDAVVRLKLGQCNEKIKQASEALERQLREAERAKSQAESAAKKEKEAEEQVQEAWTLANRAFKEFYRENADLNAEWARIDEAIEILGGSLKEHPTAMGYFYRGMLYREKNMLRKSEQEFSDAIKLNKDYGTAYMMRGIVYFDMFVQCAIFNPGMLLPEEKSALLKELEKKAIDDFRNVGPDAKIPGEFLVYKPIFEMLRQYGLGSSEGIDFLQKMYEKDKSEEFLYWIGLNYYETGGVADWYLKKVLEVKPHHARSLFMLGLISNFAGDNGAAESYYARAIKANPWFAEAYINRGELGYAHGDFNSAFNDADTAVKIDGTLAQAYVNRGNASYALGNAEDAVDDFTRATEIKPNYYPAYFNRGTVRMKSGDLDSALADYDRTLQINPEYKEAYNNRANVKLSRNDFQGAIDDFTAAIRLDPGNAVFYENRGVIYHTVKDYGKALEDWSKACQLEPGDAEFRWRLGNAMFALKDFNGAINEFSRAITINPAQAKYHFDCGAARLSVKDYDGAIKDFNEAVKLRPDAGFMYEARASVFFYKKLYNEALDDFDKAVALDPALGGKLADVINSLREKLGR